MADVVRLIRVSPPPCHSDGRVTTHEDWVCVQQMKTTLHTHTWKGHCMNNQPLCFYGRKWQGNCGRRWLKSGCHGRRSHLFEVFCFPFISFWFYALPLSGRVCMCLCVAWNKRKISRLICESKVNFQSARTGLILGAGLLWQYLQEYLLCNKNEELWCFMWIINHF